jgi:hypothetical protein
MKAVANKVAGRVGATRAPARPKIAAGLWHSDDLGPPQAALQSELLPIADGIASAASDRRADHHQLGRPRSGMASLVH